MVAPENPTDPGTGYRYAYSGDAPGLANMLHLHSQILSCISKRAFSILDIDIELHVMLLEKIDKL